MSKTKDITTKDLHQEATPATSKRYNESFKQQAVELLAETLSLAFSL